MIEDEVLYSFSVPLFVILPRKTKEDKKVNLSFNQYHNWCTHVRNDIKQRYQESIERTLLDSGLVPLTKIRKIKYTLYLAQNRTKADTRNFTNLVDKYLCDALVRYGYLKDDNWQTIITTEDTCGGVDRKNPRVEVQIYGYPRNQSED